jgi:hypothetical protein
MVTEIGPKKVNLVLETGFQIILIIGLLYYGYRLGYYNRRHPVTGDHINDGAVFFVLIAANLFWIRRLLYIPYWVIMDDEAKTFEVKYLMLPAKKFELTDITAYSNNTISSRSESTFGIYVHLKNGSRILLSDIHLDNYSPVEWYLSDMGIKNLGEEA